MHSGPVTRLRIAYDDAFLFSVSEDATVYIHEIRDKDGRGAKRDKVITRALTLSLNRTRT